jgi:hypothetical protein
VVRTNLAANDTAFNCVMELEDEAGVRGVKLAKELMSVAGGLGCKRPWKAGAVETGWRGVVAVDGRGSS